MATPQADWFDEQEHLPDEPSGPGLRCPQCGRFAKPGSPPQTNIMGEMEYSVICSVHGEVWTS